VTVRTGALIVGILLAVGAPAAGHHSIAGVYDRNQTVTLEGTISEFHLVNPHAYLTIVVDGDDGRPQTWKLEMDNRYELVDVGVKPDTLRPGDRIVVRGSRARDGSRSLYLIRLDRRADGFWYEQVGSSPRVGVGRSR
jgi:hypothetical protein